LAADCPADPFEVLLARVEDAHPQAVERADDEPDVEVRRRGRRPLEHALPHRAQPLAPLAVDLERAV
jgi:hypothetical protein